MPVNSVVIVGNLTRDPELKGLPSGSQVCDLGVAVNERVKGQSGQWEDQPSFLDVSGFGGQAEACAKFLAKGRQVAVQGRLRQERWLDKQTNNSRSRVKIIASEVQFVGGKPDGQQQGHDGGQGAWGGQQQPQAPMGDFGPPPVAQQGPHTDPSDDIGF